MLNLSITCICKKCWFWRKKCAVHVLYGHGVKRIFGNPSPDFSTLVLSTKISHNSHCCENYIAPNTSLCKGIAFVRSATDLRRRVGEVALPIILDAEGGETKGVSGPLGRVFRFRWVISNQQKLSICRLYVGSFFLPTVIWLFEMTIIL